MAVQKFNEWIGESFDPAEMDRLGDLGLDDRSPNEILTGMIDDWFDDPKVKSALETLNQWMDRRLGNGVHSGNVEQWQAELTDLMLNFDPRSHGTFEIILMQVASDSGIDF